MIIKTGLCNNYLINFFLIYFKNEMVGGCYKTLTVISNYYGSKKKAKKKAKKS